MGKRATVGTCLASLVKMAVPLCQQAERACPRTGPGRKPEIADWVLAVLIMVAVVKRKKSKSAQYRFLDEHRRELTELLGTVQFAHQFVDLPSIKIDSWIVRFTVGELIDATTTSLSIRSFNVR